MNALPKRVLVVDDDPVVTRSIDRVLSEKGYAVSKAASGPEALKKFAGEDYDVVFTDIRMPGMDGLEVAGHMRERRPWVPVVIITGYGTSANEAKAEAMGVADFLHKPLSPETIERSARKALRVIEGGARPPQAEPVAVMPAAAAEAVAVATPVEPAPTRADNRLAVFLKNAALFLAAPFIGLAYALAFPFVGFYLLARAAVRARTKRDRS